MARQTGLIRLRGSIGDVSYYKTKDGWIARQKAEINAERIAKDPAFRRTRENGQEFGSIAKSGKLLRESVGPLLFTANDNRTSNRVIQLMAAIKNLDITGQRGKRNVGGGMNDPQARVLLKGFNFNKDAVLSGILAHPFTVDPVSGEITITHFVPINHLAAPSEATHVYFMGCWVRIDFVGGTSECIYSNEVILPLDAFSSDIVLTPSDTPSGQGTDLFLLNVSFLQDIGGNLYSLMNGAYNSLAIVDVV